MTAEGMLYRMRTCCPWRDVLNALVIGLDWEWEFIDGSYVKARQHSAGASDKEQQAIGKSRAGNPTKIHLAVDRYGLPVEFEITGGEVNDCSAAPDWIGRPPDTKAIRGQRLWQRMYTRADDEERNSSCVPGKRNALKGNADMDWGLYRYRHLVENAFTWLKHYRTAATRYDNKLKRDFESMVAMACGYLWLPM